MFRRSMTLAFASLAAVAALPSIQHVPALASSSRAASASPAHAASRSVTVRIPSRHVLVGRRITVRGGAAGFAASTPVALQRLSSSGRWVTVARTRVDARQRFVVRWAVPRVGRRTLRVAVAGTRRAAGRVVVYRRALASWYGPGLYGGPLACGGRLHEGTLGVANKSLPCGTKVTVRFRGRSVSVPVVDRGPYVGNREFDLTGALRNRLRFDGVGTVLVSR